MSEYLDLYDYRLRVGALYRERNRALAVGEDGEGVWQQFREGRNLLFAAHPQSALDEEQKQRFTGLPYFPYNPAMRFEVEINTDVERRQQQVPMNAQESMMMTTVARLQFAIGGQIATLSLYWLDIYGGGLFLPFRDTTSPTQSYGSGRYLFDTIKGSDFLFVTGKPASKQRILLDFNYAYNPSCAYNDRWFCPLAPVENRLAVAINAGEMKYKE